MTRNASHLQIYIAAKREQVEAVLERANTVKEREEFLLSLLAVQHARIEVIEWFLLEVCKSGNSIFECSADLHSENKTWSSKEESELDIPQQRPECDISGSISASGLQETGSALYELEDDGLGEYLRWTARPNPAEICLPIERSKKVYLSIVCHGLIIPEYQHKLQLTVDGKPVSYLVQRGQETKLTVAMLRIGPKEEENTVVGLSASEVSSPESQIAR